ncbi:hypothetical protein M8J75_009922 [Diaphorina citri]|nr:hypothetical protein M8J75_009922 [Diaphorina citri]
MHEESEDEDDEEQEEDNIQYANSIKTLSTTSVEKTAKKQTKKEEIMKAKFKIEKETNGNAAGRKVNKDATKLNVENMNLLINGASEKMKAM